MSINMGSASVKGKVCKTFTRRFDSDPRLQSKPHSDWPSGDFTPYNLDALKTAQNGEDKPKPCGVRGQQRGQQRGQTRSLLVYDDSNIRPLPCQGREYQSLTDILTDYIGLIVLVAVSKLVKLAQLTRFCANCVRASLPGRGRRS